MLYSDSVRKSTYQMMQTENESVRGSALNGLVMESTKMGHVIPIRTMFSWWSAGQPLLGSGPGGILSGDLIAC